MEEFKCPDCKSSLFHIEENGKGYRIKCWKSKDCNWSMDVEEVKSAKNE